MGRVPGEGGGFPTQKAGSAPLLIASGLTASLAGRFETLHLPHWPFAEMSEAVGWSRYGATGLLATSIARDVLLLLRVDKPAAPRSHRHSRYIARCW